MYIVVLGISHQTASVEVREKLSFSERQLIPALGRLLTHQEILEGVILSTCNRTEIYALATDLDVARDTLVRFWMSEKKCTREVMDSYSYFYALDDALRHLHRVTAGVDSLIIGEGQILAQVKASLAAAQQCDAVGQFLETAFQQAIKAGKQVRTETRIDKGSVSVSSAAVEVASKHLGDLENKIVLIYGAGKMSAHTVKALFQKGAQHVYIINRTLDRAQELASAIGGEAISMEAGRMLHAVADLVICSTSAPHYLITPENYPLVPGKRRLMIDIAVPRNIDPALADLPGVEVLDLDGLEAVAKSNREERANQIIDAEVMIENNMREFMARLATFHTVPTIQALTQHMEELAASELSEFTDRHAGLLERDPKAALERFAHNMIGRVLHPPLVRLKTLDPDEQQSHAAALARLFDLEVEDATARYLRKRLPQRLKARQAAGELVID